MNEKLKEEKGKMSHEVLSTPKNTFDIAFIILHYMEEETTIECVNYIENNIDTERYYIIVVDNASPNHSGVSLQKKYKYNKKIKVLLIQENIGFARGNNVGFRYAKEKLYTQYIVLMNNDVYLIEKRLLSKLNDEYNESQFSVLGPMILTKDGRCDINPVRNFETMEEVKKKLAYYKTVYFCIRYFWFFYQLLKNILGFLKKIIYENRAKQWKKFYEKQYNVQLHGCFLVFSKQYIDRFDGLDSRTFFYMEEDILFKKMMDLNMITVVNPDIIVYHKEAVSTDAKIHGVRQQNIFRYKNYIKSCKVLLDIFTK